MGELEGKISEILGSPEDMQKIMNIARSLTGGVDNADTPDSAVNASAEPPPAPQITQEENPTGDAETTKSPVDSLLDNFEINPEMIKSLGSVMGELTSSAGGGGGSSPLLDSIGPFLKQERQEQLKRAFSLAKMAKVALAIFTDPDGGG